MSTLKTTVTKRIIDTTFVPLGEEEGQAFDIPAMATILVTSEDAAYPVDRIFSRSPEEVNSRWVAAAPGKQYVIIDFDQPQSLHCITLEIHETERARSQQLEVSVSHDGGKTYRFLLHQRFNFSPPGTTYEREQWHMSEQKVTHLRLDITPDTHNTDARASLTSLVLY